jgi:ribosomal protein S18 acetylase RimI-like enzyme
MIAQTLSSPDLVSTMEFQEAAYWSEYYRDVPLKTANSLGIRSAKVGTAGAGAASKIDILAFNRVIGLGMEYPAAESQIAEIIGFYKNAGVHRFFVQTSPYAKPEDLPEVLQAKGFQYHNNWVKFFREIEPLPLADSKLRIEQIGAERADVFADIIITAFEWPEKVKPLMTLPVGRPGWKHYLVYDGDKTVACGALFIRGEFATLAFAATLPEYRGLGAQSALIARRFRDAAEAGCHWMLTETAEETPQRPVASFRNMRRHGFEVAYKRPNYIYHSIGD